MPTDVLLKSDPNRNRHGKYKGVTVRIDSPSSKARASRRAGKISHRQQKRARMWILREMRYQLGE